mgnify:CR=1 FL=1
MRYIVDKKYKLTGIIMMLVYLLLSAVCEAGLIKDSRFMLILWLPGIFAYIRLAPKINSKGRIGYLDKINFEVLIMTIAYYALRYLIGILIFNLGRSPYAFTPTGILYNIADVVPQLVAGQLVRYHLINTYCSRRNNEPVFYSLSFILAACEFNWNLIKTSMDLIDLTQLFAREVLPNLCESILLSFLALYGSVSTPVIYIMTTFAFEWLIPILPDLNWFCEGILGTIAPVIMISYITTRYNRKRHREKVKSIKEQIETTFVLTFSVLLIWFVVGVFPIYPSVVATGSMEPLIYPGDIILIRQIRDPDEINKLEVGDVIQFAQDNILITHRIIGIEQDDDGRMAFRTKGDNNSTHDLRLVYPEDIKGSLVRVIPKLGYPTLLIKERKNISYDDIEF